MNKIKILDFFLIDFQLIKLKDNNNIIKLLPDKLINELNKILSRNKLLKILKNRSYDFGLFFISDFLNNQVLLNSFNNFLNLGDNYNFFDPILFSNSILNYFSFTLIKKYNIKGYSNSYILCPIENIFFDFLNLNIKYGIFIEIRKKDKIIYTNIIILKKVIKN